MTVSFRPLYKSLPFSAQFSSGMNANQIKNSILPMAAEFFQEPLEGYGNFDDYVLKVVGTDHYITNNNLPL